MQPELFQQMRDLEDRHWWFRGRRRIVAALLETLDLPAGARLLDLGCGTGGNLETLSRFGEVTGVELDPLAAELARQRGQAPVMEGHLPKGLPVEAGEHSCVTMLDVLEHIESDEASLEAVFGLLSPGGYLVLTVPAFEFLWGPHDEAHHHQRRYRSTLLRQRLQAAGFQVRKLSYYNTWLFPLVALVRLFRRVYPGGEAGVEVTLPPAFLNRALETLFASERFVLKRARFPFGVSLIAAAQKPDGADDS